MRSAQCDRRNRSCRPANPDRECSARPSWRQLTGPLPVLSNCPAGATFSQPSLRKSVGLFLGVLLKSDQCPDELGFFGAKRHELARADRVQDLLQREVGKIVSMLLVIS